MIEAGQCPPTYHWAIGGKNRSNRSEQAARYPNRLVDRILKAKHFDMPDPAPRRTIRTRPDRVLLAQVHGEGKEGLTSFLAWTCQSCLDEFAFHSVD